MTVSTISQAALGGDSGRWPLPEAHSAAELWLRAVAAGGQGRYACARADLAELLRLEPRGRLVSLARSTQGSFLRQQGWHRHAAGLDGAAWALAGGDPEAGVDALAGLAADALGVRRLAASAALLERAERLHRGAGAPPARLAIRLAWVRAELAMAGGDGPAAVRHARRAVELSAQAAPELLRHRVKSDVVLAAALCTAGDVDGSRSVADAAMVASGQFGLVPLRWALSCLLLDIGSAAHSPAEMAGIQAESAAFVTRHGGRWSHR